MMIAWTPDLTITPRKEPPTELIFRAAFVMKVLRPL